MFVFKLQAVLDAKKTKEEQVLAEFSDKMKYLEKEKQALASMGREKDRLMQQLRDEKKRRLRPGDVELQMSYLKLWNKKIVLQRNLILKIAQELERKRRALLETMQDRKIIEKLKERHFTEHKMQMSSLERIAADETAVLRYERKDI